MKFISVLYWDNQLCAHCIPTSAFRLLRCKETQTDQNLLKILTFVKIWETKQPAGYGKKLRKIMTCINSLKLKSNRPTLLWHYCYAGFPNWQINHSHWTPCSPWRPFMYFWCPTSIPTQGHAISQKPERSNYSTLLYVFSSSFPNVLCLFNHRNNTFCFIQLLFSTVLS